MKIPNTSAVILLLTITPILSSAYISKNTGAQVAAADYYYTSANRLIQTGKLASLDIAELADLTYWSTDPPSITYSATDICLKAICFDHENANDGGADGQLSLKEAINVLRDYYVIHNDFPSGECIAVENASIKVKR
jgi:hypothetical protein